MGRGGRQMVKPDKYGFPRTKPKLRRKSFSGFMTGDIVKAVVTKGKNIGAYTGRVTVIRTGSFNIKTKVETVEAIKVETVEAINHKYWKNLHKSDG